MSKFNISNGHEIVRFPTNNHHLIGLEDCNKTKVPSSWHVADEIPGVSCWIIPVNDISLHNVHPPIAVS